MALFFTSDLHLGHRFVADLRGFTDPAEHDAAIIDHWQRTVHKDDHVWVLGDVAVSSPNAALTVLAELPGTKHLVAGNHDACHPMHREAHKWQPRYLQAFASVQAFARRRIAGQEVLLSHFPYSVDRTAEARYPQYRLPDRGRWLLHGHTHGTERLHGREIHIGLDAWDMQLVRLDAIETLIKGAS